MALDRIGDSDHSQLNVLEQRPIYSSVLQNQAVHNINMHHSRLLSNSNRNWVDDTVPPAHKYLTLQSLVGRITHGHRDTYNGETSGTRLIQL